MPFSTLSDSLSDQLGRTEIGRKIQTIRALQEINTIVKSCLPTSVAQKIKATSHKGGVLTVSATDPALLFHLREKEKSIMQQIADRPGLPEVRSVRYVVEQI